MMKKALFFLVLALPVGVQAAPYTVVSNKYWTVTDASGGPVGNAQTVCLNASNCPAGAMPYGFTSPAWTSISGATWIWASMKPDGTPITGATNGAANAQFIFQIPFWICGDPKKGIGPQTIAVAADNYAEVIVNNVTVLTISSFSQPTTINLADKTLFPSLPLHQGQNIIQVKAKNGAGCDQYQCNPAGVVLKGEFVDELVNLPTCANPRGDAGDVDPKSCPQGQSGNQDRICACYGSVTWWQPMGTCSQLPPTCTDYTYSAWSACGTDSQRTRKVTGYTPAGCAGTPSTQPVLIEKGCHYVPPTCTSFTYSAWGECQANNTQTRTVLSSSPAGCTGGTPVTTQTCPNPPLVGEGDMCWEKYRADHGLNAEIGACPSGTTCKKRLSTSCSGWWIFKTCDKTWSTDSFCDR